MADDQSDSREDLTTSLTVSVRRAKDFVLRHGGPGVLQAMADAAFRPAVVHPAASNGLASRGPALSVPMDRCA